MPLMARDFEMRREETRKGLRKPVGAIIGARVRHPVVPIVVSGLILLVAHLHGCLAFVLPVLPLLFLVLSLLSGHYPGCETIVRLAERIAARPLRGAATNQRRPAWPKSHSVTGGLLIAFGLAQRPPPLPA
jgi:hypothetical protein